MPLDTRTSVRYNAYNKRSNVVDVAVVDECIRVGVAFDNRKAIPMWFLWRKRYYKVKAVNYTWCTNQGSAKVCHYSVTDGANTYELQFNTSTLDWTLGKVCTG